MLSLNHPDQIEFAVVNEIGSRYLEKHAKPRSILTRLYKKVSGSNQAVAQKLKELKGQNVPYNIWINLAAAYGELEKHNELSIIIDYLVSNTFNNFSESYNLIHPSIKINTCIDEAADPTHAQKAGVFKLMIDNFYISSLRSQAKQANPNVDAKFANSDTAFNAKCAQKIAENYFKRRGGQGFFNKSDPSETALAMKLKNFTDYSDSYENWLHLARLYGTLSQSKGLLSDAILTLFLQNFGHTVSTRILNYSSKHEAVSPAKVSHALEAIVKSCYATGYWKEIRLGQGSVLERDVTVPVNVPSDNRTQIASPRLS